MFVHQFSSGILVLIVLSASACSRPAHEEPTPRPKGPPEPKLAFKIQLPEGAGALAISPDGERLAYYLHATRPTQTLAIRKVGAQDHSLVIPYEDRGQDHFFFSPDGTLLASHREDKIFLNDVADGKLKEKVVVPILDGFVRDYSFAPDSKTLAVSTTFGKLKLWSLETKAWLMTSSEKVDGRYVAFTQQGKNLVAIGTDQGSVWNVQPFEKKETFSFKTRLAQEGARRINASGNVIAWVGAGDDGRSVLITADSSGAEKKFGDTTGPASSVEAISPGGETVVTVSRGRDDRGVVDELRFWDVASGRLLYSLKEHGFALSFSRNGKRLAAANASDKSVRIYDLP